jgi:hypothetical protein
MKTFWIFIAIVLTVVGIIAAVYAYPIPTMSVFLVGIILAMCWAAAKSINSKE